VVIGSSNTDMVVRVDHLPRPGETVLGGTFLNAAGGKGANQAVGAARAGGRVTFIARVGDDALGEAAVAGYERDGIDVSGVSRDRSSPSGVALIMVSKEGENSIAVAGGANNRLSPADIKRAAKAVRSAAVVVLQLETPLATVQSAADLAYRAGALVILNPAPARPLPNALLKRVSILTPNETEAELLTGVKVANERGAAKACALLRARGARTVILTLGKRGAYVSHAGGQGLVPGFAVEAVDTTAAGDIFNGALAVAMAENRALPDAIRFAHAAAALSVTRVGAQPSAPRRPAILKFLTKHDA
jgi:ribokinase